MNPEDIPKRYGGKLDFDWGDVPHLDDEARVALEKDGHKGWVRGPQMWLDNTRVIVGAENGKLRRNVENVQQLKPVVYAADDTEVPVHANRRSSSVTRETIKQKFLNGTVKLEKIQSENVVPATAHAAGTTAVPAETNKIVPPAEDKHHAPAPVVAESVNEAAPVKTEEQKSVPATDGAIETPAVAVTAAPAAAPAKEIPNTAGIPQENIHKSPQGSAVNLPPPSQQPGFPQQTAEYISSSKSNDTEKSPSTLSPATAATAGAAATATAATAGNTAALTNGSVNKHHPSPLSQSESSPVTASRHPPAIPEPGPTSKHNIEVNKAIAEKLTSGGESVSVLPAEQNGVVPHPDMVVSSDRSKGLAVEKEKLEAGARPGMERFVTAAEF